MLRPATPLTVLLLLAFGFLLISVLSVPVTKMIPMGSFKNAKLGVFGFCKDDGPCSPLGIGYNTAELLDNDNQAFDLPIGVRDSISVALVIHPIVAFLALVMFIMAALSHLHGLSHSTRYLLVHFILILVTFVASLAALLVDVLLFIPHLAWGSYMVLAATIILGLSSIGSCALRRALVSRLAHRRRVAENPEMNGENYYSGVSQSKPYTEVKSLPTLPSAAETKGTFGERQPQFAAYDIRRQDIRLSEERIPLTQRSPSVRSPEANPYGMAEANPYGMAEANPYGMAEANPYGMADLSPPARGRAPPPRDPYAYAANVSPQPLGPGPAGPGPGRGRGGMRGGPGPRGRGMGWRGRGGPMRGRGGPGRAMRGNRGGRGPPMRPPDAGYYNPPSQFRSPPSPPWHPGENGGASAARNPYDTFNPEFDMSRTESPPAYSDPRADQHPTGMGAAQANGTKSFDEFGQPRVHDAEAAGARQARPQARHETMMTEGSQYSSDEQYPPARAAWNRAATPPPPVPPLHRPGMGPPGGRSPPVGNGQGPNYWDDVYTPYPDAEFADSRRPGYEGGVPPPPPPGRARSPSGSERSHFTSISERGVNPRWNPRAMQGPPHQRASPPRRMAQQQKQRRQDMLLDNPDFQLPGGRTNKGGASRPGLGGMVPGGAYPT